ncbi:MAG TPA: hypothetical protein VH415_09780 [Nitrososphaeraceae archaeon]
MQNHDSFIDELLKECAETREIVKRIELLQKVNQLLPIEYRVELPNYITNSLIDKKLYLLQQDTARVLLPK